MKLSELLIPVHFLIPEQEFGEYCESFQTQCYPNPKEAKEAFKVKSNVLLNINDWGTLEKKVMAKFELRDKKGELKKGQPEIGDLISIQLGGIPNLFNEGSDWVEIADLQQGCQNNIQYLYLKLRPTSMPGKEETAHFLKETSTNTLILAVFQNVVQISIHGRNEALNTEVPDSAVEKIRNDVVGKIGFQGLNQIQWQGLCDGIMKNDHGE